MPKEPLTVAELHVLGLIADHLDEADASLVRDAVSEIERLRKLLLTALALHGGEAHTYSEKEWRAEARATLGIKT